MSVAMIVAVAALAATGTFLVTSRSLSRIVLGFALLGHAAVLALVTSGGRAGEPPIVDQSSGKICATAAQRPGILIRRLGNVHTIAAGLQNCPRGVEFFTLEVPVEGIGPDDDIVTVVERRRARAGLKDIAPPARQGALRC